MVRHPLDRGVGVGRPATGGGRRAGRHSRRGVGDHRSADAECSSGLRVGRRRARPRRGDRGVAAGEIDRGRPSWPAAVGCRRGPPGAGRGRGTAGAVLRRGGGVPAGALGHHARPVRDHRLVLRPTQPHPVVIALPAQCGARCGGGGGGFQCAHRICDVQCVHRVRWRHSGAADPGRRAHASAGSGVGCAADRRRILSGGDRAAVCTTAAAVTAGAGQTCGGHPAGGGDAGGTGLRRWRTAGQLRACRRRPGDVRAGGGVLVPARRWFDRRDGRRGEPRRRFPGGGRRACAQGGKSRRIPPSAHSR